jgi:hypothetical protein
VLRSFLPLCALAVVAASSARAEIIRVPADQPTIADGLSAAGFGDEVVVAPGTYYENNLQLRGGVTLRGESAESTILDGGGSGTILLCILTKEARISGLTFRGSNAALVLLSADFLIERCVFTDNSRAVDLGGPSTPVFRECRFAGNHVEAHEGGFGGAVVCVEETDSPTLFDRCEFVGNVASDGGGAVSIWYGHAARFVSCLFEGNEAGYAGGGAIHIRGSDVQAGESVFAGNSAADGGQAVECVDGGRLEMTRCTTWGNGSGAAVSLQDDLNPPSAELVSCLLAGDGGVVRSDLAAVLIRCTNIESGWETVLDQLAREGNFSADPLLCDPAGGSFRLAADSPCLPGHHPAGEHCGVIGALGAGCPPVTRPLSVTTRSWGKVKAGYGAPTR